MFASTKQDGQCLGTPDTCNTPSPGGPVPVPYPNLAMCNQAKSDTVSEKVKIVCKKVLTKQSVISQTSGDEAGTSGGVVSGSNMDQAQYSTYSSKVYIEGQQIVYLGCTTRHNGNNANCPAGSQISPSQSKVMIGG